MSRPNLDVNANLLAVSIFNDLGRLNWLISRSIWPWKEFANQFRRLLRFFGQVKRSWEIFLEADIIVDASVTG
jgi:hypothetical protein